MKFVISSAELLKALMIASKGIPTKTTDAIYENYLFVLNGNTLTITSTDKEVVIITTVAVERTDAEGSMAVPARQINEIIKEIPDQPITLSIIGENTFQCDWVGGSSTLPFFNAGDYPKIKEIEGETQTVEFSSISIVDGISRTIYASSDEDNRPVMNSIYFDISPDSVTLVASDLQKLTCYTADDVKASEPCTFILNKRHAGILKSIIGKEVENVSVTFDSKTAIFKFDSTIMMSCLVSGKYPDYRTIIPKNNSNILQINRQLLLNTTKRISVCSPKGSLHIKFSLSSDCLEISTQDPGFEMFAHEKVSCQYDGSDMEIGFRANHLIEILSNLSCGEVIMKLADKRRSVLIMPSEEDAKSEKVFGIVMPVMVR